MLFAVTWFSAPGGVCSDVSPPASLFAHGINRNEAFDCVYIHELRTRFVVFYGSAAAVIVLVGLAFGAGRRSSPDA